MFLLAGRWWRHIAYEPPQSMQRGILVDGLSLSFVWWCYLLHNSRGQNSYAVSCAHHVISGCSKMAWKDIHARNSRSHCEPMLFFSATSWYSRFVIVVVKCLAVVHVYSCPFLFFIIIIIIINGSSSKAHGWKINWRKTARMSDYNYVFMRVDVCSRFYVAAPPCDNQVSQ